MIQNMNRDMNNNRRNINKIWVSYLESCTENPCVGGSIPPLGTTKIIFFCIFYLVTLTTFEPILVPLESTPKTRYHLVPLDNVSVKVVPELSVTTSL